MRATLPAVLAVILGVALGACTKPAATPKASAGSDDGFCADLHQNCGPSSNAVSCCDDLICRPRTDETGDVLIHQCLDPDTPPEE